VWTVVAGKARPGLYRSGKVGLGLASHVTAGRVRYGELWHGLMWSGMAGMVGHGAVWSVSAQRGLARSGKDFLRKEQK